MMKTNADQKQCILKPLLLLVAPLSLAILEIWHPIGFRSDVFHKLLPQANWWYWLHLLQLPLFGLVGVGMMLLALEKTGFLARLSLIGFWIFIVFYTAFDSINGISLGAILKDAPNYSPEGQAVIAKVVQNLYHHPVVGGTHSWISEIASAGWVIGMIPLIILLARDHVSYITIITYTISAFSLWWSHAYPYGPIAFICLFIGSLFLLFSRRPQANVPLNDNNSR